MLTTADLTSADLDEIRQTARGAADPLGVAAELAAAVDAGRLADPGDAGRALALAAEIAESRSKLEAALRYADRAVEAYGTRDDNGAVLARALRARLLFRAGRAEEAMAALEPLRPLLTEHPDAGAAVSAALAVGGKHRVAEEWLTGAVREVLAGRAAAEQSAEPADAEDAGLLFFLLQQRHQVRHALGLQHDAHDNLADRLETRLAGAATGAADDDLLFWPRAEFDRLPAALTAADGDWDGHRARLERELTRLTGAGRTGLALLPGSADGLTRFAGGAGDPADPRTRAGYARTLAGGPGLIGWPPERNDACWCGSGSKYKKCCLPRARA